MADGMFIVSLSGCTLVAILVAACLYYQEKNACKSVRMWQANDMTGTMYCAAPGTVPSDLPFVPQSFSVPPGRGMDLVGVTTAGSRHINISTASTADEANTITNLSPDTTSVVSLTVA